MKAILNDQNSDRSPFLYGARTPRYIVSKDDLAVFCGHPATISYVVFDLPKMEFAEADIISILERNMKYGVGEFC